MNEGYDVRGLKLTAQQQFAMTSNWIGFDGVRMGTMEGLLDPENGARFIGSIERSVDGWRASFRLRVPSEVFTQQGDTEVFATELQATKWVHTQATARGFSSIEIRCQT